MDLLNQPQKRLGLLSLLMGLDLDHQLHRIMIKCLLSPCIWINDWVIGFILRNW